ncbi:hypothetical protein IM697_39115 [Streptomyces ferrugineus]|uniref:Uncharacterized protein n=1 Tax=Streptomyces ferrugineus TaxID=1413221 RepID=A0A7M2SI71_9ACTN|nr:hypothetical protein [Streptomyces ferrugineus]QOV35984.1 hypothetical protein IM697_39115 [Streptomyces ferrugineus]
MSTPETSRFVRLRIEVVLEVDDADAVTEAAVRRIREEEAGNAVAVDERVHVESAVTEDTAEALAYLIDPFDLVSEVPGVELAQASWSSERIEYDPDSPEWDLDEDDGDEDFDGENEGAERAG